MTAASLARSLAVLVGALALGPRGQEPKLPVAFCVSHAAPAGARQRLLEADTFAAAALALGEAERADLLARLEEANVRWEARANPLLEDLGSGEPDDELFRWLARAPEPVRIAVTASSERFCGADGFCVEAIAQGSACPAGTSAAQPREIERARFLAWPLGHGVWIRARSEAEARATADALRLRSETSATIGLVVHGEDPARVNEPPLSALRDALARREALRAAALGKRESTAPGDASTTALPFALDAREILVVPRVAALAHRARFEAEIREIAPDAVRVGTASR